MNAVHEQSPRAEYFRCVANGATMSRALCERQWQARRKEDGSAACLACPAIVREAVQGGGVELITAEEVHAGIVPKAVGETMQIVLGKMVESQEQSRALTARAAAAERRARRWAAIVEVLTGHPWQSAREVGRSVQAPTNSARVDLLAMVAAGKVIRRRPLLNGRPQHGAVIHFALAGDADAPLVTDSAVATGIKAGVLQYVKQHPGATTAEVAVGIRKSVKHIQSEVSQCLASGWLRREGTRHVGYRWTVAGEQRNQEGESDG